MLMAGEYRMKENGLQFSEMGEGISMMMMIAPTRLAHPERM
jgi:hypothetical protein